MDQLRDKWDIATDGYCDADVSNKWWSIIEEKFSNKERNYHNHEYLAGIIKLFDQHRDKMTNAQAVALAIFFHKLEYDPRTGEGDDKSQEQFKAFATESKCSGKEEVTESTKELLEAVARNLTEEHMTEGAAGTADHHYLLDMAVAVLGTPPDDYKEYTTKVQEEYAHLSPQAYSQLRLKILQSLLLIPNVYATKDFQILYEKQARENIAAEITLLKKTILE